MLPEEVMLQVQSELLDWRGTGISVLEMNHRSEEFISIRNNLEAGLRSLLLIPENYRVLFLQGGARSQFSMIPLNIGTKNKNADYLHTGYWSGNAAKEANRFISVNVATSTKENGFKSIPAVETWQLSNNSDYTFYTSNETIDGVEFQFTPDAGEGVLVSDMTSNLLSRPVDVSRFGLIFAGAQKNIGPAGLVIIIIRDDLIQHNLLNLPGSYDYSMHEKENSLYYTPTTFSFYVAGLVTDWIADRGGLEEMANIAIEKSGSLYKEIDQSSFYRNEVNTDCRSRMNIIFSLESPELTEKFISEAAENNMVGLRGHSIKGGIRASLYNAMPIAGVNNLINFMDFFRNKYE